MSQQDRSFTPDFIVVPAGSTVSFPNLDPIFHNVFSLSKAKSFDLGNYSKDHTRTVTFTKPGIVFVGCHLHANMSAVIVVTPNRWATTGDPDGHFTLQGVPPGTYTIVAWHKTAGFFRKKIEVTANHTASVEFAIPIDENGARDRGQQVKMRLSTRAFLWSFVPFALLLAGSFWVIQRQVQSTVREGLHSSLRDAHQSMARMREQSELQNSRFLRIVAENPSLKSGLQLLLSDPKSGAARLTVEDQLRQIAESLRFDFLVISDPSRAPLAGVIADR